MAKALGIFIKEDLEFVRNEQNHLVTLFAQEGIDFTPLSDPTPERLFEMLTTFKDKLTVLHFSGHSDNESLQLFQGHKVEGKGLMPYLNSFPNLKFVFINGCCNDDLVSQLDRIPVVVGSQTAINDRKAADFSKHFYNAVTQSGGNASSIKKAFEDSKNLTNAVPENSTVQAKIVARVRGTLNDPDDVGSGIAIDKWVMYHEEGEPHYVDLNLEQIVVQTDFRAKVEKAFADFKRKDIDSKFPVFCHFPALFAESFKKFFISGYSRSDKDCSQIGIDRLLEMRRMFSQSMLFFKSTILALSRKYQTRAVDDRVEALFRPSIEFYQGNLFDPRLTPDWISDMVEIAEILSKRLSNERAVQLAGQIAGLDLDNVIDLNEVITKANPGQDQFYRAEYLFEQFIQSIFFVSDYNIESVRNILYFNYPHYEEPEYQVEKIVYELEPNRIHLYSSGKSIKPLLQSPGYHHLSSVFLKELENDFSLNLTPFIIDLNSLANRSNSDSPNFFFMNFYDTDSGEVDFIKNSSLGDPINTIDKPDLDRTEHQDHQNEINTKSKEVIRNMMNKYLERIRKPEPA